MKVFAALVGIAVAADPADCNFGDDKAVACEDATTCCAKVTGVDLSAAVGEEVEGLGEITEETVADMETMMMGFMEKAQEKGDGSCMPLAESTYEEDGGKLTYECGDDRVQSLDDAVEALDDALDGVDAAANCVTDNLLDPDAQAECLKYAGKDCEDEEVVRADEKDACLAHASANALYAGAIALIATAALM